ncbi:MAG: glycosyltransferase family 4 protein [Verrucomicrobiia bacterium]
MHLHWIANCVVPPPRSLSGGDRIMVECLRRWASSHRVTVYGWEGTRQLFEHQGVKNVEHVLWSSVRYERLGFAGLFAMQTLVGWRSAGRVELPDGESHVIVSSSDFPTDSLPALRLKRRHPRVPWVAPLFLFAPPIWDALRGRPGPGLLFSAYLPLQRWILQRLLREAEMILVTGEEDRARMIALGRAPESVFAVRGGVDLSIPRSVPEPSEKKYDAVFIGRFHPQKGVREILRIWSLVQERKLGARLAMIGKGPLEAELYRLRASLGLERTVDFLGFQDGVDKYRIIKSSRVVVHPAVYDSGGMAPAEALACGLPGVAFDLPALETYYPKGFLKVPQGDLAAFAARLVALLDDPVLYARISAEAQITGAEWNWDVRAKQVLDAIFRVMVHTDG